jgi:hypothetical protein
MKGDLAAKGKPNPGHGAGAGSPPGRGGAAGGGSRDRDREPAAAPPPIDDALLRDYLADALPVGESARVEKALRDSAELRARLEDVRQNRSDGQLHTLGAIWHRSRLTCPSREQLGKFLLDALDPALASYFQFHLDVVECPFCQANLADLKAQSESTTSVNSRKTRQRKILQASQHMLSDDQRNRPQ